MSAKPGWQLVVEFPDQSASFALGVETGKIWEQMKSGTVAEIDCFTMIENREVLRRIADHLGWKAAAYHVAVKGWDHSVFTKVAPEGRRLNPQGLHIV